ncbi:MAG TPA: glycosyltransferase family 4 protein [Gemmataceae bacterium]|nr:glycosyltransferase family 4 protein [Gemmataceae bacterium]
MSHPGYHQRICVLSSSTFSQEGGIQQVTRMILRCLRETWPGAPLDLFSLHDARSQGLCDSLNRMPGSAPISYWPCGSSRTRFSSVTLRALMSCKPGLVIVDHVHLSVIPWLARRFASFPMVTMVHYAELWTLGFLRRQALRQSDLIIAVSEFTKQTTHRVLGANCSVKVCNLGLHPEYPQWAESPQRTPDALANRRPILVVGRMADQTRDKGHEALLRAMPDVARRVPEALLVIVGRGPDQSRLRDLSSELGIQSHVHFAGFVPGQQLPAYYEAAEVFAMPSNSEGFGLVYLEAMYHSKPCIAGDRDGAREVVRNGETGLLVEPGNVDQLRDALLQLLLDRETAQKLGAAGRTRLQQYFTYDHFAERLREDLSPFLATTPQPSVSRA